MEGNRDCVGWDAITAELVKVYGEQKPLFIRSQDQQDRLYGIIVFKSEKDLPHWHYISLGFTELFDKRSPYPDISGFGFEVTFRVPTQTSETEAPAWPAGLMMNLGRSVFESRARLYQGDYVDTNGPIACHSPGNTKLEALMFCCDPDLPDLINSGNGKFEFLQLVGITANELEALKQSHSVRLVELLRQANPYLITDLQRQPVLTYRTL